MWLGQVEIEGHGLITDEPLSAEEQSDEYLLMGLRLREGVDIHRYEALSGRRLARSQIDSLAADGFVTEVNGRIMVTPVGAPYLDTIVADLAA
jgi:coproporphyrinogen III oxidase-like Fe-S oxidoreductase